MIFPIPQRFLIPLLFAQLINLWGFLIYSVILSPKMTGGQMAVENITLDSNQSVCDVFVYQRAAVVLFPIFYSVVFIISVCGNSLVLYVICQRKQKFNSTSIYLVNLALSDSLFTLALPGRIIYYIRHFDWPFGDLLCRLTTLLFFANTYAGNISAFVANTLSYLWVCLYLHLHLHLRTLWCLYFSILNFMCERQHLHRTRKQYTLKGPCTPRMITITITINISF